MSAALAGRRLDRTSRRRDALSTEPRNGPCVWVRRNSMSEKLLSEAQPVSFGERLANSQAFADVFRDGMALVEETATYLDGPGRAESKKLERAAALAYATESMRLTTRLMQLASWLLLHRAVKEGEMSLAQANKEKTKVKLSAADSLTLVFSLLAWASDISPSLTARCSSSHEASCISLVVSRMLSVAEAKAAARSSFFDSGRPGPSR